MAYVFQTAWIWLIVWTLESLSYFGDVVIMMPYISTMPRFNLLNQEALSLSHTCTYTCMHVHLWACNIHCHRSNCMSISVKMLYPCIGIGRLRLIPQMTGLAVKKLNAKGKRSAGRPETLTNHYRPHLKQQTSESIIHIIHTHVAVASAVSVTA